MPITHITRGPSLGIVRLYPVGIDDLSAVRYIHATAFRTLIAPSLSDRDHEAWLSQFYNPAYTERLIGTSLIGAWVGRDLVGTAGWIPHPSASSTARIDDLFVLPMFAGNNIGEVLLTAVEASASESGYQLARVDVPLVSVDYFQARGYQRLPQGDRSLPSMSLPVVHLAKKLD